MGDGPSSAPAVPVNKSGINRNVMAGARVKDEVAARDAIHQCRRGLAVRVWAVPETEGGKPEGAGPGDKVPGLLG
jgi:hypothetical protein